MSLSVPRIEQHAGAQGTELRVLGEWTAANLSGKPAWQALMVQLTANPRDSANASASASPNAIANASTSATANASATATATASGGDNAHWDLQLITKLDHLGAQLLWAHWGRAWPTTTEGLQPN